MAAPPVVPQFAAFHRARLRALVGVFSSVVCVCVPYCRNAEANKFHSLTLGTRALARVHYEKTAHTLRAPLKRELYSAQSVQYTECAVFLRLVSASHNAHTPVYGKGFHALCKRRNYIMICGSRALVRLRASVQSNINGMDAGRSRRQRQRRWRR